jgi:hypothetical protein
MSCGLLRQDFAELSAFDEADDWVADEVPLRGRAQRYENIIVTRKKAEVL